MNPLVAPYLSRSGVDRAGDNAVVVHLSLRDGRVIEGPGRGAGTPWTQIRLLVSVGSRLPSVAGLPADSDIRDEGDGFERIIQPKRRADPGILHFNGPCAMDVFATQSYTDGKGRAHFLAEMQVERDLYLQYLYGAQSRQYHRRYADWVCRWYRAERNAGASQPVALCQPEMDVLEDHGSERFRV
ncbi:MULTISPECIES: hypothetical protein [Stenotrophomonas]|uniref:hypothetical protein n=1 Tax=Stenotrophomonas TaxID=40323 RepID=UPI0018D2C732|nr:hypothetical protein [Stenotrophomonas sp.]MBH1507030.1 hypothetical protein [Stenotrophomonas maltophilia]